MSTGIDLTLERLHNQIDWYDAKSQQHQRLYKWLKILQLIVTASVPVLALLDEQTAVAAVGAAVLLLEGLQQLGQYQANWISYRSTCEQLKHEKFLHGAKAGPYAGDSSADQLLAERIEGLISQEHAKWVSGQPEMSAEPPSERLPR